MAWFRNRSTSSTQNGDASATTNSQSQNQLQSKVAESNSTNTAQNGAQTSDQTQTERPFCRITFTLPIRQKEPGGTGTADC